MLHIIFGLTVVALGFVSIILMTLSSQRFVEGEIRKLFEKMLLGILFLYSTLVLQLIFDIFTKTYVKFTFFELTRYLFLLYAFVNFFWAAYKLNELSKVLGFKSEKMPKKLKKIIKR